MPPEAMAADVITMNFTVVLMDVEESEHLELSLCYSQSVREEGQVSVLALIGTAILGYRIGDVFSWDTPAGPVYLRVERVLYQPEAAGVYD